MTSREPRRQAILEAAIRIVGRKGYEATSVADVVAEAGASRATFYKYFDHKQGCFLAAYEVVVERVFGAAQEGCRAAGGGWPEPARTSLATIVGLFAADPSLARVALIEGPAAGDEARRQHWAAIRGLARLLDRERRPRRPRLPAATALMAVSGVVALIFDEVRDGRAAALPSLLPELEFALLVPFVGPQAAARETRRSAGRSRSLQAGRPL
jgi:AcrR family transcriptional regulator